MADFNQAVILGNLTRDPELRSTQSGQSVASFTIATNRRWTTKDGQQQEETEFHNIVAWGKLAEIVSQILYKGRKVLVAGRLRTRQWEGQDGIKRYSTEIVADHVSATGPSRTGGEVPAQSGGEEMPKAEKPAEVNVPDEINLDDIPF
ncbi:single-stranded DNA-binding protein [Candidatus Berkelbacteria bacterium]|nr:single-stranded DNA-binding protein [Candidatus Berkelbacteria bacterium]